MILGFMILQTMVLSRIVLMIGPFLPLLVRKVPSMNDSIKYASSNPSFTIYYLRPNKEDIYSTFSWFYTILMDSRMKMTIYHFYSACFSHFITLIFLFYSLLSFKTLSSSFTSSPILVTNFDTLAEYFSSLRAM